jgi:hypothetical protein
MRHPASVYVSPCDLESSTPAQKRI